MEAVSSQFIERVCDLLMEFDDTRKKYELNALRDVGGYWGQYVANVADNAKTYELILAPEKVGDNWTLRYYLCHTERGNISLKLSDVNIKSSLVSIRYLGVVERKCIPAQQMRMVESTDDVKEFLLENRRSCIYTHDLEDCPCPALLPLLDFVSGMFEMRIHKGAKLVRRILDREIRSSCLEIVKTQVELPQEQFLANNFESVETSRFLKEYERFSALA